MQYWKIDRLFFSLFLLIIFVAFLSPQFPAKSDFFDLDKVDDKSARNSERALPPPVTDQAELLSSWGGSIGEIAVRENLAYVANGHRMVVLDVSDPENPLELGSVHYGEPIWDLILDDNYVYVASHRRFGNQLGVIDISDPENPELVWSSGTQGITLSQCSSSPLPHIDDIAIYQDTLYMQTGFRLFAFDIGDPRNVKFSDVVFEPCLNRNEIVIDENNDRMYVLSDRGHPVKPRSEVLLQIYDLSQNPINPTFLGELDLWEHARELNRIKLNGDYAYIVGERYGPGFDSPVMIADISDPLNLSLVSTLETNDNIAYDVAVHSNYLFFTNEIYNSGRSKHYIDIYDVSDPSNPVLAERYSPQRDQYNRLIWVFDSRLYMSSEAEGLIIFDIANPLKPDRVGKYVSPTRLGKMVKQGNLLYVSDKWNGFTVLDLNDRRSAPEVVGTYQTSKNGREDLGWGIGDFIVENDLAYLALGKAGIEIINVSNPESPFLEASIPDPLCAGGFNDGVQALTLWKDNGRNILSAAGCGTRFVNLDITDINNAQVVGSVYPLMHTIGKIEIHKKGSETYVFLAELLDRDSGYSTTIVNTTDVSNPEVVYSRNPIINDLEIVDNLIYFSGMLDFGSSEEIFIQNISNPLQPMTLSRVTATEPGSEPFFPITVTKDFFYGTRFYGVGVQRLPNGIPQHTFQIWDVNDPENPVQLDALPIVRSFNAGGHDDLLVDGSFVYFTDNDQHRSLRDRPAENSGLYVLRR